MLEQIRVYGFDFLLTLVLVVAIARVSCFHRGAAASVIGIWAAKIYALPEDVARGDVGDGRHRVMSIVSSCGRHGSIKFRRD